MSGDASENVLRWRATAEPLPEDCQAAPFVIRQPQSPTVQLPLQNPVFFSEVLDGLVLLALHEPDQSRRSVAARSRDESMSAVRPATFSDTTGSMRSTIY